jgi:hypothetical protein
MEPQLVDDQTTVFAPRYARGASQRQLWGDPLWGWRLRFDKLASTDRAFVTAAALGARGKGANVRLTPGLPIRGSFPATELFSNNDFTSTTGWTGNNCALTAVDGRLRATNTKAAGNASFSVSKTGLSVTQYAPYALRGFISGVSRSGMSNGTLLDVTNYATDRSGLVTQAAVQLSSTTGNIYPGVFDAGGDISMAGDFGELAWTSYARCILVDNGPNLLKYSDQIDNAIWNKSASTITPNNITAPDGTTTADALFETTATAIHNASQDVTISSAAADYCYALAIKVGAVRGWAAIQLNESAGPTAIQVFFNLSTGAIGTTAVGAGWSNLRTFVKDMGNNWWYLAAVAKKTSAATGLTAYVYPASADNVASYAGNASAAVHFWRMTVAQSSVPVRLTQTTSSATSGAAQTGGRMYVKGGPASASASLVTRDFFEVNGELKQLSASIDFDAAGLGVLQFRPGIVTSPADNDPVIVLNPMGRFYFANDPRIVEHYGVYTDFELDLLEAMP